MKGAHVQASHKPPTCPLDEIAYREFPAEYSKALCKDALAVVIATDTSMSLVKLTPPGESEEAAEARMELNEELAAPRPLQLFEGKPLIRHVVESASEVFGSVVVLVDGFASEIEAALAGIDVRLVQVSREAEAAVDATGKGRCLLTLSKGRLATILGLLEGQESAVLLYADQPLIKPRHITRLMERLYGLDDERDNGIGFAGEAPDVPVPEVPAELAFAHECCASWIEWRRVFPLAMTKGLLERLTSPEYPATLENGFPCVPDIDLTDVVFGEEKLNGYLIMPPDEEEWAENCDINDVPESLIEHMAEVAKSVPDLQECDAWASKNRADFPILQSDEYGDLVYLDASATSQMPMQVMEAVDEFLKTHNSNIWRGYYKLANDCTFDYEGARKAVAEFIGAAPRNLIFAANTTGAINMVAKIWGLNNLERGDLVLLGISEHHSNMLPWFQLRDKLGIELAFIPYDERGAYDQAAYAELLQRGPKLVTFAAIGNTMGLRAPIAQMTALAHEVGARVCLDAAQALAHMKLDVEELGIDFMAFSSHKAYGPKGIGGLYVSPSVWDEIDVCELGGGSVSHVGESAIYLRTGPTAYEFGTPAIEQAIGFARAIEYLQDLGMDAVERHARAMCEYAFKLISEIDGVCFTSDISGEGGFNSLLSFNVAGVNCLNVSKSLGRLGVCIRGGAHCAMPLHAHMGCIGAIRVSMGVYTTVSDIDKFVLALRKVIEHYEGIEARP